MKKLAIEGHDLIPRSARPQVVSMVKRIVAAANLADLELSIYFVLDDEIRALNRKWRNKNKVTDVLSFSAQEGKAMPGLEHVLGDLVIGVDAAMRQAQELGHTLDIEIAVLVAHGLLHLFGIDHEKSDKEARLQMECELSILDCAGIEITSGLLFRNRKY